MTKARVGPSLILRALGGGQKPGVIGPFLKQN